MSQAVTETGELVWQTDENGNLVPQMKRNSYGGADWVETQKAVLQEQTAQMETMFKSLEKGADAEKQLISRIEGKSAELDEVKQDLTDKKKEVVRQEERLEILREDTEALVEKVKLCEAMVEYFKDTDASDREHAYFEQIVELKYENGKLQQQNEELKAENRTLRAKLEKAYDFMRQFTIGGMNMLEKFLRSIGEWVQQKVARIGG